MASEVATRRFISAVIGGEKVLNCRFQEKHLGLPPRRTMAGGVIGLLFITLAILWGAIGSVEA